MDTTCAVEALAALAHEGRLDIFRLLVRRAPEGARAGEIASALGVRATTLSNQLSQLEATGLIRSHREGRSIRYQAVMEKSAALLEFLAADCCRGRPEVCGPLVDPLLRRADRAPSSRPIEVLFLCTGNSTRSLICEALLMKLGGARFRAHSAGSAPRDAPHPMAIEALRAKGCAVEELHPKPWTLFSGGDAPELDFVITVCDRAVNETCPVWPGRPISSFWPIANPGRDAATDLERRRAFDAACEVLEERISAFVELALEPADAVTMQRRLDKIAELGRAKGREAELAVG